MLALMSAFTSEILDRLRQPCVSPARSVRRARRPLLEAQQETEGPMRVGTRVRETRRFLGIRIETVWEVTEYEPITRSSVKGVSGPIPLSGSYLLESLDASTRFIVVGELEAHRFFKLAEPLFARMAGRELEASLGHLKDLLEAEG